MPILSGYCKRTSGRQLLLLVITYIATIIAVWTIFLRGATHIWQEVTAISPFHGHMSQ